MAQIYASLKELSDYTGHRVKQTGGSVLAGLGDIASGKPVNYNHTPPKVEDFTSKQDFERYKEYNTETNLRANRIHFYAGLVRQGAGLFLGAATTAIGVVIGMAINAVGQGATLAGAVESVLPIASAITGTMLGVSVALTVGAFFVEQFATRQQSDKGMNVGDFQNVRLAKMMGQEVSKQQELQREVTQPSNMQNRSSHAPALQIGSVEAQERLASPEITRSA